MFRVPRHFTALPLQVRQVAASAAVAVANAVASTSAKRTLVFRFILMSFFLLLSLQFRCVRFDRQVAALVHDRVGRRGSLLTAPVETACGLFVERARDAQPLRVQVRLQGLRETREVEWSAAAKRFQAALDRLGRRPVSLRTLEEWRS